MPAVHAAWHDYPQPKLAFQSPHTNLPVSFCPSSRPPRSAATSCTMQLKVLRELLFVLPFWCLICCSMACGNIRYWQTDMPVYVFELYARISMGDGCVPSIVSWPHRKTSSYLCGTMAVALGHVRVRVALYSNQQPVLCHRHNEGVWQDVHINALLQPSISGCPHVVPFPLETGSGCGPIWDWISAAFHGKHSDTHLLVSRGWYRFDVLPATPSSLFSCRQNFGEGGVQAPDASRMGQAQLHHPTPALPLQFYIQPVVLQ
mmetsp:Transcript_105227/g.177826  ORF Transcript_105227/g.177826 Transcript_105227/m.177826 type:complete len:260 (+) Transcript_105227:2908-3687(+)